MRYSITFLWEPDLSDARIDALITSFGLTRSGAIEKQGRTIIITVAENVSDATLDSIRQALIAEVTTALVKIERLA